MNVLFEDLLILSESENSEIIKNKEDKGLYQERKIYKASFH